MNKRNVNITPKWAVNALLVTSYLVLLASIAQGQSAKTRVATFEAACARIMNGPAPIYAGSSKLDVEKYWVEGFDKGVPFDPLIRFNPLIPFPISADDREALAVAIKNEIGKVGVDAYDDFRMLLACATLLQPITRSPLACRVLEREKNLNLSEDDVQSVRNFGWLRSVAAETQVRDWLTAPEKLERMVWFLCWKDNDIRDLENIAGHANALAADFGDVPMTVAPGAPYWENARAFLVMACLTSRSDLYQDADPAELQGKFMQWHEWFLGKNRKIRASRLGPFFVFAKNLPPRNDETDVLLIAVPEVPFPDWGTLPPAIPPRAFGDISDFVR